MNCGANSLGYISGSKTSEYSNPNTLTIIQSWKESILFQQEESIILWCESTPNVNFVEENIIESVQSLCHDMSPFLCSVSLCSGNINIFLIF
jgi:hypothetical protein